MPNSNRSGILVLCHRRTTHLGRVINAIENAINVDNWDVVFCVQDATEEVLEVISSTSLKNHEVLHRNLINTDMSTRQKINSNLYFGLEKMFLQDNKSEVVVIEDDILISPHFLNYMKHFLDYGRNRRNFRGVNSISTYLGDELENAYGKYWQGLMWGWGITDEIFMEMMSFWKGNENCHWDYFLEPYLRSGYVINPLFSLAKNIGFDKTATHTHNESVLERYINESFQKSIKLENQNFQITDKDFRLREDFIPLSRLSWRDRLVLFFIMKLSFKVYVFGIKFHDYSHFVARILRTRFSNRFSNNKRLC